MNKISFSLSLALLCTFCTVSSVEWQAGGNVTDYLPYIWAKIEDHIGSYVGATTDLAGFAKNLSDTFTARWDPAWNVFIVELKTDKTLDAIVMGYAFNDHWLWHNNYQYNGRSFSFIIWKDYNCKQWNKVSNSGIQGYTKLSDQVEVLMSATKAFSYVTNANSALDFYGDIWAIASLMNQYLRTQSPDHAYTIVGFQKANFIATSTIGANFCSVGGVESYAPQTLSNNSGKKILLFTIHTMAPLSWKPTTYS